VIQGDQQKMITFEYEATLEPIDALIEEIRQLRQELEETL